MDYYCSKFRMFRLELHLLMRAFFNSVGQYLLWSHNTLLSCKYYLTILSVKPLIDFRWIEGTALKESWRPLTCCWPRIFETRSYVWSLYFFTLNLFRIPTSNCHAVYIMFKVSHVRTNFLDNMRRLILAGYRDRTCQPVWFSFYKVSGIK